MNDSIHIQFVALAFQYQSARRMPENVEVTIVHRTKNTLGLFPVSPSQSANARSKRCNRVP